MFSNRNSRRVTVGDVAFRYKISTTPKSNGIYRLNITVQREEGTGSKLIVAGVIQKDHSLWPRESWDDRIYYPTVTRHEAAWFIQQAIAGGWDPAGKGRDFILEANNEVFRIGGVLYVPPEVT